MGEWRTLPPFGTLRADSFSCFIDLFSRRTPQEFGFFVPFKFLIVPNRGVIFLHP
jgi:hypothetical protein